MKRPPRNIVEVIRNRRLFGSLFRSLDSWWGWQVWLKSVFGLPMDNGKLEFFEKCTGRELPSATGYREVYTIVGRRGGKSRISAFVAVHVACFHDWRPYLSVGETGVVLILARDRDQARVVFNYIKAILESVPVLKQMVTAWRTDEIELENQITVAVKTSDYRSVRGPTVVCCIADEVAFWDSQGVSPDAEIFQAIRPAMVTIPAAKLIAISTGYAQAGVLFDAHRQFYGKDDHEILVWQAPTRTMNPTISETFIAREMARDPIAAQAEYLGLFREDIEAAFSLSMIESCTVPGRQEIPPQRHVAYVSFDDPSGGRGDAWAKCICHVTERGVVVVDCLKAWKAPFDPSEITRESAELGKHYGLISTVGDAYAGNWVAGEFAKNRVGYTTADKNKSELYLTLIPMLTSRQVELLDSKQLTDELRRLERRKGRAGKDSIDHPLRGGDDIANSVAGAVYLASEHAGDFIMPEAYGERVCTDWNFYTEGLSQEPIRNRFW